MTGTISKHRFTSFVVALSMLLSMFTGFNVTAQAATEVKMQDVCVSLTPTVKVNGQEIDQNTEYSRDTELNLTLNYELGNNNVSADDVVVYELPTGIKVGNSSGPTISSDGSTVGRFEVKNNKVYFTFYEQYLNSETNLRGKFDLKMSLDKTQLTEVTEKTFNFPSEPATFVTIKFKTDGYITKDYQLNDDGTLTFAIYLNSDVDLTDTEITDLLGSNLKFAANPNFRLDDNTPINAEINGQTAKIKIDQLKGSQQHTIKYEVEIVNPDNADYNNSGSDMNKNTATWNWNGTENKTADKTVTVNTNPIQKSGWVSGDTIVWQITVNPDGSIRQNLKDATLTDTLPYGLKVQSVKMDGVVLDSSRYTINGTNLVYKFGNEDDNKKHTFEIITDKPYGSFYNSAAIQSPDIAYKSDDATVTVNRPSISKTHVTGDIHTGIATWKITVPIEAVNHLDGDVTIKDILGDAVSYDANWQGTKLDWTFAESPVSVKLDNTALTEGQDYTYSISGKELSLQFEVTIRI